MWIILKQIGTAVVVLYLTKVCFKQMRRIKKNYGITKGLNYLCNNLNNNSKELQIYKNMYVSGMTIKNELITDSNSIQDNCLVITVQNVRRNQAELGLGKLIYTAPTFFLQNKDQKIEINTLNQLQFSKDFLVPFHAEELSAWDQFLYWFGLKSQKVLAGIPYGKKTVVYGDFIYNPNSSQLRCYKVKELAPESDYKDLRIAYICFEFIKLGVEIATLFWLIEKLHNYYKEYRFERDRIQQVNIETPLISNKKQSMQCSKCNIKISNVLYKPCFHLDCCEACSQGIFKCPVCYKDIIEKVKIYNE